jgi:hypothetical protein
MLVEIQCEEFMSNGEIRPPITFHKGLNAVLGTSGGSNAIGKSTFLLIIDFVFGGNDYVRLSADTMSHIGDHTIKFAFEFDGEKYYFSRSTDTPQTVNRCDSQYQSVQQISVKDYCQLLFEEYLIGLPYLNFSEVVQRYFRIYRRGNDNERRPLVATYKEKDEVAVDNLMKLLGKYGAIENYKNAELLYDFNSTSRKRRKGYIVDAGEIERNKKEIAAMEERLRTLNKQNEEADLRILGIDAETATELANIKQELKILYRRKTKLLSQYNSVQNNVPDGNVELVQNFDTLTRFFPNAEIKAFMDIENFHKRISEILTDEIGKEMDRLRPLIEQLDNEILQQESRIANSGIARSLSQSILTQYAKIKREIEVLEEANIELLKQSKQQEQFDDIERRLSELRRTFEAELSDAERLINAKMAEINSVVTDNQKTSPILEIDEDKSFDFNTPDDTSEGTSFKSLVVYDLSILELTHLPALIHDSNIVKRIEDVDFERILSLYNSSGKQVFIAFDKADSIL